MSVMMAGMDHRTVWRFTGAVLGQGLLHARWCAMSGVMVSDSAENCLADSTGAARHHGHLIPVVAQRLSLWLRLFSRPLRFHCCRFDVSVVQDRRFHRCSRGEDSRVPHCSR